MRLEYLVDIEEMPLKEYIIHLGLSLRLAKKIKLYGKMYINGTEALNYFVVKKGDLVVLEYNEAMNQEIVVNTTSLDILYEDDDLLVINKPHDLAIQPSRRHHEDNLISRVKALYVAKGITSNVHIVNRLDYATSGLVIVAKNGFIHHQLTPQKAVIKKYLAIVEGRLAEPAGRINLPIARLVEYDIRRAVSALGQEAITNYRVITEYEAASLVEFNLETGRTHQIRVHMAAIGHPILGDKLYGTEKERLYLHCYFMEFVHPVTKEKLSFSKDSPWNV
ncbi:MAG TPA: RluA family pseudouridine synthase [Bacilli bacterium]|nr:RluA family pseudouridine synthase [Bacilli bacterium]